MVLEACIYMLIHLKLQCALDRIKKHLINVF